MIPAGSASSATKCRMDRNSSATGWSKSMSSHSAGSARIASGSSRSRPDHRGARDAVQHAAGVRQHHRVVVDVDDPGLRAGLQGDLVRVAGGGQAGADVDDLPDAGLADQVTDHPAEEGPVPLHRQLDVRQLGDHRLADGPVGRVVVLAAEQVVVDPRHARDIRPERLPPVTVVGHQPDPPRLGASAHNISDCDSQIKKPRRRPGPAGGYGVDASFRLLLLPGRESGIHIV